MAFMIIIKLYGSLSSGETLNTDELSFITVTGLDASPTLTIAVLRERPSVPSIKRL
ncbi:hypothetical protein D1872_315610 [compost metagenome]